MGLKSYFNVLIKRLWIVILIPLLAAGAALGVNLYVIEPEYESSITLYVMNKDADSRLAYDDFLASQQLINDCRELVKSRSVTRAVIDQLNLEDLKEGELAGRITVALKNDTRLLEIKVRDQSNERALQIVNKISSILRQMVNELMKFEILDVIDEAELPLEPVSPRPLVNTIIAYLAALFLSIAAVFLIDYLDDTIKSAEDIEKLAGIKVIGIIPTLDLK